ncbi:MAG TPA: galactose-1-phosphate uridylyltransferase, partial [Vicinamibacterales bacterium]|nr:galactose-1-phosphate uridylyltransferase [Vicinamibacterales bacterium]
MKDLDTRPHVRFNPLRREWVLVSPQRNARPWQGQIEPLPEEHLPAHDPSCYLCPRSSRARGQVNPDYRSTFVFDNDFPALVPGAASVHDAAGELLVARAEPGACRVVCFSPRHDLTLSRLHPQALRGVVDVWVEETRTIGREAGINYVQIFENRGAAMGASNPHPHGQIWATATVPNEPAREQETFLARRAEHGTCLICEYLAMELARGERTVCANDAFAAIVPFWAVWPFETIVISRRHVAGLDDLTSLERDGLADVLKRVTTRYDNLFETPFPYSMGFHQRPSDGAPHDE